MTAYVEQCLHDLRLKDVFDTLDRLYIFSDGANKHFKNRNTLALIRNIATALGIVIVSYVWCSYDGKGRYDGHFSVGKCMHIPMTLQGERLMDARDYFQMNNRHLPNTEATLVEGLQTQQGECVLHGVINKFHKVEFNPQLGDHVRF